MIDFWGQIIFSMKRPEFVFDENLRDVPKDLNGLKAFLYHLESSLATVQGEEKVNVLGEAAVYRRILGDLQVAENYLLDALDLIGPLRLGRGKEIQQLIRLAHVYQYQKRFDESDEIFNRLMTECDLCKELQHFRPFVHQHAGKSLFDQGRHEEALRYFEHALDLRMDLKVPEEQIESSKTAIRRTRELLRSNDD